MPRRSVLSAAERDGLLALPDSRAELLRTYAFSASDIRTIRRHRGLSNRLGFAVQLCYMRYPGIILRLKEEPSSTLLSLIAQQLEISPALWPEYGQRSQTRREHLVELQETFGFEAFAGPHHRLALDNISELAEETDKGIILATALVRFLRARHVLLPTLNVIERICAEAVTRGNKRIYQTITADLDRIHRRRLDALLDLRESSTLTNLAWMRQSPSAPSPKHLLEHVDRIKAMAALQLPVSIGATIHPNRLLKIAREGAQMTAQHLGDLESTRRYATLVAVVLENKSTVIDEVVDWHDRMIGKLFNRAKRTHEERFAQSGKAINEKVRLYARIGQRLIDARQDGSDAFEAIEDVIPWADFAQSVLEAQRLSEPESFDYLHLVNDGYTQIRRYAPALLEALDLKATPAALDVLSAVHTLKTMNASGTRKIPDEAPTGFIRKRWESLVFTETGIDRRSYELCALSELKNSLRSGDIWVEGSRQFKDFDAYLLPTKSFAALKTQIDFPLSVPIDCAEYLDQRLALLAEQLEKVNSLAAADKLPDARITNAGLRLTPLVNAVPDTADRLIQRVSGLMPHVKITELLMEVDEWTDFTREFTHIKSGAAASDKHLLLTAMLADAINLGMTKMAESCPGTSYARLSWLHSWHVRDETYSAALAILINAQAQQGFAAHWGDGSTSSSDGQRFRAGGRAEEGGNVNPKYGSEPGVLFYTHISDQYAPFHTKVINVGVRDATYVLDGLLYHESDLRIEEHYTDTAGFTDHLFALMHLLDFRFAPRIRDLADKRIFVPPATQKKFPALSALTGGAINTKHVRAHWDDILRLATSIKKGTVTASLMLRKLGSYPRQNGLAIALRELGRIERSLFTLEWLQDVELRRRVQAGLNKGEAKNALARAIFFNRLGELRDRTFENQRYRASGLNLVVAAIVLWNTVYIERAVETLRKRGEEIDDSLLQHLSPLGWEHINLTGDYVWRLGRGRERGKFRPLRPAARLNVL
jgi:TnpA family transposase